MMQPMYRVNTQANLTAGPMVRFGALEEYHGSLLQT